MGNRFSKPVAFNRTNNQDKKILDHTQNMNFSGYVKELILADIQKRSDVLKIVQKTNSGGIKYVMGR